MCRLPLPTTAARICLWNSATTSPKTAAAHESQQFARYLCWWTVMSTCGDRLIDRVGELAALESFIGGGDSGGLLLRGDAGVGKSMLVQEVSARAAARGWRVLRCGGVEAEASFVLAGRVSSYIRCATSCAGLAPTIGARYKRCWACQPTGTVC